MNDLALASDPTILATLDRLWAVASERGFSLSDLSAAWTALRSRLGVDREGGR